MDWTQPLEALIFPPRKSLELNLARPFPKGLSVLSHRLLEWLASNARCTIPTQPLNYELELFEDNHLDVEVNCIKLVRTT